MPVRDEYGAGRPTRYAMAEVRRLASGYRREAIATLAEIMRDVGCPPAVRVAACCALLDRDVGKPAQAVEATVTTQTYADLVRDALAGKDAAPALALPEPEIIPADE